MRISSRTPEGDSSNCPSCGKACTIDPSRPPGDAPCPNCGHLLWWFQEHLSDPLTMPREAITADTLLENLKGDSLDMIELVMAFEEEFDITIPDEDAQNFQTVGDALRYLEARRDKDK